MLDPVVQGVLEAGLLHRAVGADAASDLDTHPITGEERLGRKLPALAVLH
ncbi:MAG: hypothetical protein QOF81_498, partial [Acidimicrobiaceae bacterium]|nr:hypothetical protein [Acidimicrobiaceae bacterium]